MIPQSLMLGGSAVLAVIFGGLMSRQGWLRGRDGAPPPVRDVDGIDAPVWLACALVLQLAQFVGPSFAFSALGQLGNQDSFARHSAAQAAGYVFAIAFAVVVVRLLSVRSTERTGLRIRAGDAPRALLALVLLFPYYILVSQAAATISHWWTQAQPELVKHDTLLELSKRLTGSDPSVSSSEVTWAWVMAAGAVLGAPIVEELTFRLCLQSLLLRLTSAKWHGWCAVLLTSTVFALIHKALVPWSAVPSLFVLSLGLGIAYERTARLGVPIVMHALFNAANIAMVLFGWAG